MMPMMHTTNTTNYEADLSNKENTVLFATGTAGASGVNTLIAAPGAGKKIRVLSLQVQNESSTATVAIVKFGTVAKWRVKTPAASALLSAPIPADGDWLVGTNLALVLDLDGANSHGYNVAYTLES